MKNLIKGILAFVFITSCSSSDDLGTGENFRRYLVESGNIEYTTTTSGSLLSSTIKGEGTSVSYFKNWGNLELIEDNSTTTTTTILLTGERIVDRVVSRELVKLEDLYSYSVDFKNNKIYKSRDLVLEAIKNDPNYDPITAGEEIMLRNGGQKLDNESYMGYDCVVWQFLGSKLWGYKGVTLKIETDLAGIHTIKKATKIQFNIAIDASKFNLPSYEIIAL